MTFITDDQLREHIAKTIKAYGEKLAPYDLKKLNANIIDPIKMIFDKYVYGHTWEELISSEIFRQRDKSNNNSIGYFHQRIFDYIEGCRVPDNGTEGGWDVIYERPTVLPTGDNVERIYVEMKNKHNTMNSASSAKTYIKMQHQLLTDDKCACFLVEAIAKQSQNINWETTVDGRKVSHRLIRRVSLDQFYAITTGEADAFRQVCLKLPQIIKEVLSGGYFVNSPHDTAYQELVAKAGGNDSDEQAMALALYMLGFGSYIGWHE